jgi:hypothetical protein
VPAHRSRLEVGGRLVSENVVHTHALGALVVASLLRGLALREAAAALDERFDGPTVSKSTVSRICVQICEQTRGRPSASDASPCTTSFPAYPTRSH